MALKSLNNNNKKICPSCGQSLKTLPAGLVLTPLQLNLYQILRRGGDDGVLCVDIADKLYADYANGGPESASKIVHILKMRLAQKLKSHGIKIITTHRGRGARFKLEA